MKTTYYNLKEHKFPKESFIGGWYIPEHICDCIIQFYYEYKKYGHTGLVGGYKKDNKEKYKDKQIDLSVKDSFDLSISPKNGHFYTAVYEQYLSDCLSNYLNRYDYINANRWFGLNIDYNIQHYKIGGGFKKWHFERTSPDKQSNRVLVFMTYLNDVEDGGTEFFYQGVKTKSKKGLTLIWPTDFTHTHRGIISETKEKYIATGWYTYNESLPNV